MTQVSTDPGWLGEMQVVQPVIAGKGRQSLIVRGVGLGVVVSTVLVVSAGSGSGLAAQPPVTSRPHPAPETVSTGSATTPAVLHPAIPPGELDPVSLHEQLHPESDTDGEPDLDSIPQRQGPVMSVGDAIGLHLTPDPLGLRSAVAYVMDAQTGEVLFEKNPSVVLPIASITKIMTAMVILDARLPLDERLEVEKEDRDTERFSRSHLPVGAVLTRLELMQLALMASENRAAAALARNFPGGHDAFVQAMNAKAKSIGMADSEFVDGTGLSASNVSTARDLARMVRYAATYPTIRRLSTSRSLEVRVGRRTRVFHTTNRLVLNRKWDLSLQKTGFINEAGNCMVLQSTVDGRPVVMVLLDSFGKYSRLGDAERLRRWIDG